MTLILSSMAVIAAMVVAGPPANAKDAVPQELTGVPHYFGPFPNWANSPWTTSQAIVEISGSGTGAKAEAVVDQTGTTDPITGETIAGIDSITVTDPGRGYTPGQTTVVISGGTGAQATATAEVSATGSVVSVAVDQNGAGYSQPVATLKNGGGAGASITASGGVDAINLGDAGKGYTMPTVEFSLPDLPGGAVPKASVDIDQAGKITWDPLESTCRHASLSIL